jgi:formylglycine-generating enzyme required for sulfatase activity
MKTLRAKFMLVAAISLVASGWFAQPAVGLAGDADGDGDVDLDDFVILKTNFGVMEAARWNQGNFDGDEDVDLDDFVILKTNFGRVLGDELTLYCGNDVTMPLVPIPAGAFMMGSSETELDRYGWEGPVHQVTLSQPFYMGVYEVTQRQYEAVMGTNPSYFTSSGLDAPVERVTWDNAKAFCDALSQRTGRAVMLPTEAQWEYACRAGSMTRFSYGDDPDYSLLDNYAWHSGNSDAQTHPVGEKLPNAWGLYDMHHNVIEWCADWYGSYTSEDVVDPLGPATGTSRVWRGSSWYYEGRTGRSAYRSGVGPDGACADMGFRVVVAPDGLD